MHIIVFKKQVDKNIGNFNNKRNVISQHQLLNEPRHEETCLCHMPGADQPEDSS